MDDLLAAARAVSDDVLFPDAMRVDRLDRLPAEHLDALAAAGLYGAGELNLPDVCAVAEELASGCLATAFVWIQHFGLLRTLAADDPRRELARQGKLRGGIALAGLIPSPPLLRAAAAPAGWRLDGTAPWVTGWGMIDLVLVAARGPDDTIVTLLMDAAGQPGLSAERQRLVAVDASVTVRLDFDGVIVPADRVAGQAPFDPAGNLAPQGLRINGSLALGVARRCCRLLGASPLDAEVDACRARLDAAVEGTPEEMAHARAAASELAWQAAAALTVHAGSTSITVDQHPQRLAREALFLLVFASRPAIKNSLFNLITSRGASPRLPLKSAAGGGRPAASARP
jgi:hypothetical protein